MINLKTGFIGLVIGVILGAGITLALHKSSPTPINGTEVAIATVAQTTHQTDTSDRTITTVTDHKPSGETVTTTTQNNVETHNVQETRPIQTKYRFGIKEQYDLTLRAYTTEFNASKRVYGNFWIDGGYNPSAKQFTIGVSYEL